MLYPLKFKPIYKTKVWGGEKIKRIKDDKSVPEKCGESWEVSGIEGDESIVENGFLKNNSLQEIIEVYMEEIVGDSVFEKFGYEFPILLKIIDAADNLSIQVHPNDEVAAERHNTRGKSEAWYIIESDPDAIIVDGFKQNYTQQEIVSAIQNGTLENIIKCQKVKQGEFYYIPAGRVHGLCRGVSVIEIQETSDITYRMYDYNRGNRELHVDLALDVLDCRQNQNTSILFDRKPDFSNEIIKDQNFNVNFLPIMNILQKDYGNLDSFVIYHCLHGRVEIKVEGKNTMLSQGETVLIPACISDLILIPIVYSELLEIYMDISQ